MASPRPAPDRAAGPTLKITSIGRFPATLVFFAMFVLCGALSILLGILPLKRMFDLKSLVDQGFTHSEKLLLGGSIATGALSQVALLAVFVVVIFDLERNQDVVPDAQRPQPEPRRTTGSADPACDAEPADALIGFNSKRFLRMLRYRTTFISLTIAAGLITLWLLLKGLIGVLEILTSCEGVFRMEARGLA